MWPRKVGEEMERLLAPVNLSYGGEGSYPYPEGKAVVPSSLLKELVGSVRSLGRVVESLPFEALALELAGGNSHFRQRPASVQDLKPRALEVLSLMARGYSNRALTERLSLQPKTVENYINGIYQALELAHDNDVHPRVRAVLRYLDRAVGGPL